MAPMKLPFAVTLKASIGFHRRGCDGTNRSAPKDAEFTLQTFKTLH